MNMQGIGERRDGAKYKISNYIGGGGREGLSHFTPGMCCPGLTEAVHVATHGIVVDWLAAASGYTPINYSKCSATPKLIYLFFQGNGR